MLKAGSNLYMEDADKMRIVVIKWKIGMCANLDYSGNMIRVFKAIRTAQVNKPKIKTG